MAIIQKEKDFQRMWEDAKTRFKETIRRDLTPNEPQRLEEVLAAQGASIVFGPANMCFNAMQFLIKIPGRISDFYDDLKKLFHEISTFLKQFKVYQRIEEFAALGVELKESAHNVLIIFVEICAISIDIVSGSKFKRLITGAKIALFDDDSDIPEKLKEFRTLMQHHSQLNDAITLEHVLALEHDMTSSIQDIVQLLNKASEHSRQQLQKISLKTLGCIKLAHEDLLRMDSKADRLLKDADKKRNEKKSREQFEEVCNKLSLSTSDLLGIEKHYNKIQGKIMNETGSWLPKVDVYQQWAKAGASKHFQLLLSGLHGSGKSLLAFSILNNFKTRRGSDIHGSDPVGVAFHEFSKVRKAKDAVKDSLKYIAAQLFKTNIIYSRNLHKFLEGKNASFLNDMSIEDI